MKMDLKINDETAALIQRHYEPRMSGTHDEDDEIIVDLLADRATLLAEMKAYKTLIDDAFDVTMNMNDTFAWATADAEYFEADHFAKMAPIIAKYGSQALTAYASVRRGVRWMKYKEPETEAAIEAAHAEIVALGLEFEGDGWYACETKTLQAKNATLLTRIAKLEAENERMKGTKP